MTNEITQLQKELVDSSDANRINILKDKLDEKSNILENLTETKLKGLIMRSKANIVEYDEKNSKYFASLEKNDLKRN